MHFLNRYFVMFLVSVAAQILAIGVLPAADTAAPPKDDSFSRWKAHSETLLKDPSLVRLYLFNEGKGLTTANSANIVGDKKGNMTILSNSPYGESREVRWWIWNSPLFQTFPEW